MLRKINPTIPSGDLFRTLDYTENQGMMKTGGLTGPVHPPPIHKHTHSYAHAQCSGLPRLFCSSTQGRNGVQGEPARPPLAHRRVMERDSDSASSSCSNPNMPLPPRPVSVRPATQTSSMIHSPASSLYSGTKYFHRIN